MQNKPAPISIVCASGTKTMATYAKQGLDEFDIRAQIAKWSLTVQAGEKKGFISVLDSIYHVADRSLQEIFKLAEMGNEAAIIKLHNILAVFVSEFEKLCHARPELYEATARKTPHWPAFISKQKSIIKHNKKLIAKLHLGEDANDLDAKGNWSYDAAETKAALSLYGIMNVWREEWLPENVRRNRAQFREFEKERRRINKQLGRPANYRHTFKPIPTKPEWEEEFRLHAESRNLAKNLPPFNKQTYRQWFEASWPLFRSRYSEEFQNKKCFSHFVPVAQKIAGNSQKKLRGELRKYIKKRILAAFEQIAPDVDLETQT